MIKKGDTIYTDLSNKIHETDEGITCCGREMQLQLHIDGEDFYESQYKCECGNVITVTTKREEGDCW